ncbi:hypothetical protein MA16_Dca024521 [Dendrobium catenatum]|uniref:Uncharacterized protein n=1 Tax=Dendrobium catenatum TaxID=906689 RepID=A0A2I0VI49_9ASPA|nr:hypothetical protein MA16_Dca024521 [Dendrobium catenatum]
MPELPNPPEDIPIPDSQPNPPLRAAQTELPLCFSLIQLNDALVPVDRAEPQLDVDSNHIIDPPAILSRRPPTPSEMDNAGLSRRPRTKEMASMYLSSYSSSLSTTSTSYSSNTTISLSSSNFCSRRFPSPLPNHRSSTPSTLSQGVASKRSQSVDRTRPSSSCPGPRGAFEANGSEAERVLCTTTRSLSVSFQGQSFFYQTSKAKASSMTPSRKPTPDRRRPTTAAGSSTAASRDHSDGSGRVLFDSAELSASSDTDGVSSGSNSGAHELNVHWHARVTSRGISVSARFWQETNGRLRRKPEPGTPVSSVGSMSPTIPRGDNSIRHLVQKILDSGWTEIPMALADQIAKRNDQHLMAVELYENYNVGIWNDDTAGVEMPSLNAAEKVDSVQCIQTIRRNDVK